MEKAYKRYLDRLNKRKNFSYAIMLFTVLSFFVLFVLAFYSIQYYFIFAIIFVFGMMASFIYTTRKPWGSETLETYIFANLYKASQQLDLFSSKDKKSEICLKQARKNLENVLFYLTRYEKQLKEVNSNLVKAEFGEPIRNLKMNIRDRILPRISDPKEIYRMHSVLMGLADMFGEIQKPLKLAAITERNNVLESFEKITTQDNPEKIRIFLSRKPVKFVLSICLGAFIISCLLLIHSFALQNNFLVYLSSTANFIGFIAIVIALGSAIYTVIKKP